MFPLKDMSTFKNIFGQTYTVGHRVEQQREIVQIRMLKNFNYSKCTYLVAFNKLKHFGTPVQVHKYTSKLLVL